MANKNTNIENVVDAVMNLPGMDAIIREEVQREGSFFNREAKKAVKEAKKNNSETENKTKVNYTRSADVSALVDEAFVPDMTEKTPKTAEEKQSAFFASLAGHKVTAPVFAKPENGLHSVVIHEMEYKAGRNGRNDYFAMQLKDTKKNIIWDFALSATAEAVMGFLNEVNMYSNGVVMYKEPEEALSILRKRNFNVWTLQYKDQHGIDRVKSYSNPDGYEKFSRYINYHSAEVKKAEEAYKAHKEEKK